MIELQIINRLSLDVSEDENWHLISWHIIISNDLYVTSSLLFHNEGNYTISRPCSSRFNNSLIAWPGMNNMRYIVSLVFRIIVSLFNRISITAQTSTGAFVANNCNSVWLQFCIIYGCYSLVILDVLVIISNSTIYLCIKSERLRISSPISVTWG